MTQRRPCVSCRCSGTGYSSTKNYLGYQIIQLRHSLEKFVMSGSACVHVNVLAAEEYACAAWCMHVCAYVYMCAYVCTCICGDIKDTTLSMQLYHPVSSSAGLHLHLCMHTFELIFLQGDMHVSENASIYMHTLSLHLCSKMLRKKHAYAAMCLFRLVH